MSIAPKPPANTEAPPPARARFQVGDDAETVLVVDDERFFLTILGDFLTHQLGMRAILVQDSTTALSTLESEKADLVLLDILMPDMDGLEVLRRIKDRSPALPVVMVTASLGDRPRHHRPARRRRRLRPEAAGPRRAGVVHQPGPQPCAGRQAAPAAAPRCRQRAAARTPDPFARAVPCRVATQRREPHRPQPVRSLGGAHRAHPAGRDLPPCHYHQGAESAGAGQGDACVRQPSGHRGRGRAAGRLSHRDGICGRGERDRRPHRGAHRQHDPAGSIRWNEETVSAGGTAPPALGAA